MNYSPTYVDFTVYFLKNILIIYYVLNQWICSLFKRGLLIHSIRSRPNFRVYYYEMVYQFIDLHLAIFQWGRWGVQRFYDNRFLIINILEVFLYMPEWLRHSASLSCCVNNPEFNSHFLIFINLDNLVTKFHTDELQKSHPTVGDISNIDTAKGKIIEEGVGQN